MERTATFKSLLNNISKFAKELVSNEEENFTTQVEDIPSIEQLVKENNSIAIELMNNEKQLKEKQANRKNKSTLKSKNQETNNKKIEKIIERENR